MKSILQTKILMIVTAICVVGYIAFGYFFPETGLDNLAPTDRLNLKKNIVVLGVDERSDDVGRSDTLFVVMFDSSNKSASLLSVPRDTRVRIDGHGWDKINHAYAYGGRELTQKTVEELLGIKINNYVMVDFKGFTGLVDAIGGIDIDVEKDMYYHDTWDGFTVDLKKGRQHLDGKTAIQYVRFRDEEGDIGRIRRQQHFLMAVYDKITSADMLLHIPGLAKQLTSMVKTDMPLSDMIDLGRALHSMVKEKGLSMAMVPGTPKYIDGISYWLPDITDLRELMVKMQGATMTEHYKSAAELMEKEYNNAVEKVEKGDDSEENKEAIKEEKELKAKKEEKVKEEKNFDVLKYDGVRALRMQQFDYAAKCFVLALELNADDLECRDYLSQAYISLGDMQNAYTQLMAISAAQPNNVAVLLRMADVLYMTEDYAAMAEVCEKALQLDSENIMTYYIYAKAYKGLNDLDAAVAMLSKAIDRREDFDVARLLRGNVLLENNQTAEAALDADNLYQRIEENEDVLLLKARVEKALGNLKEAEKVYTKAIDFNPFLIEAYKERSEVRSALGDTAGAKEDQTRVDEMEQDIPQPTEGIEENIKKKMQQMDPYKVFYNEY
jgi:LCP family protein required for cell wall assembly